MPSMSLTQKPLRITELQERERRADHCFCTHRVEIERVCEQWEIERKEREQSESEERVQLRKKRGTIQQVEKLIPPLQSVS
jgi:hypothetical protein